MCGIAGVFHAERDRAVERQLLMRMNESITHRGPDDAGIYIDGPLGFAHRRLSVIDLASGHQPMLDKDLSRAIVYNGEIYNFRELRKSQSPNTRFETDCDTEVVLKSAAMDSVDWLDGLNGMFAFAIWDFHKRQLLLARDRLGIKPLYYAHLGDTLVFASEIKTLLLCPGVSREPNIDRLPEYLAFRAVSGNETMFKNIYELPPAHAMTISQDDFEPRIRKFWKEGDGKDISAYADPNMSFEEQFEELLTSAVRYRLISDVPVGSFNSGGVDSSLISAVMRSLTEGELHTFSVGFEEPAYDESKYSKMVANQLKTNHHTLVVNEHDYVENLERTLLQLEEPINHAHTIQLLLLSRLAREFVTVALTGEGADELFGGYPRLQIPLLAQRLRIMPAVLSKSLLRIAETLNKRKLIKLMENAHDVRGSVVENSRYVPKATMQRIVGGSVDLSFRAQIYDEVSAKNTTLLGAALNFDQRTYLPSLLNRLDKVSMASSLECRVPFLDFRIVEWSNRLPDHIKMKVGRTNKHIVKKVAENWLPKEIVYRKKVGFGTPIGEWFRNPRGLGTYLDILTDSTFRQRDYFDAVRVAELVREHLQGSNDHSEALWGLMNIELWCRTFLDSRPNEPSKRLTA